VSAIACRSASPLSAARSRPKAQGSWTTGGGLLSDAEPTDSVAGLLRGFPSLASGRGVGRGNIRDCPLQRLGDPSSRRQLPPFRGDRAEHIPAVRTLSRTRPGGGGAIRRLYFFP